MNLRVDTKDPTAVEIEVQSAYLAIFPSGNRMFIPRIFGWACECFTGNYKDYQTVDARYHDFEHTLQGTLCMARLLKGRHLAGAEPRLTERMFQLGITAILLHDTGYLKKRNDTEGTGAKYTPIHVARSGKFAEELLAEKNFPPADIRAVQNMILCTGVDAELTTIPFQDELERVVGYALGTADLLGQMAADDYIEKLPVLYAEFAEAVHYMKDKAEALAAFSSAEDMLRKTPGFWDKFVRHKLNHDFKGIHHFLADPYPSGPNFYVMSVEDNISRLRQLISNEEGTTRFLKKYCVAM